MNCFCTTSACPYPVNCYHRHHRWKWQFCNFSWKYISFLYLLYFLFFSIAETGKAVNRPGRHICPWAFLGQPGRLVGIFTLVHIYSLAGCWGPPGISAVVTPIIPASWIITRKSTTKLYVCSHFFSLIHIFCLLHSKDAPKAKLLTVWNTGALSEVKQRAFLQRM